MDGWTSEHLYHTMLCIVWTVLLPDVCPSHAGILLKRAYWTFRSRVAAPFWFFRTKWYLTGTGSGTPWQGCRMHGQWTVVIFGQYLCFISEMIQDKIHSYYGMHIGNCTPAFERYCFQWLWMTSNPDIKVSPLFDTEYLRNVHSYNGILIGAYIHSTGVCHFKWPWVPLNDLVKYSVTQSTSDSWVSCTSHLRRETVEPAVCELLNYVDFSVSRLIGGTRRHTRRCTSQCSVGVARAKHCWVNNVGVCPTSYQYDHACLLASES